MVVAGALAMALPLAQPGYAVGDVVPVASRGVWIVPVARFQHAVPLAGTTPRMR